MEMATARTINRAGYVTLEDVTGTLAAGIGDRDGREQAFRIRVLRIREQLRAFRRLDNPTQIHDGDAIADVFDHREIVGDEQVGDPELRLQVFEQVDDLCLDGYVERLNRFVANDQPWVERQRAGDAKPLALSARELVRIVAHLRGTQANALEQRGYALVALGARQRLVHGE